MNKLEIAKIIYMGHQEEDEWSSGMENGWNNLLYKRTYSDPYTVSQKEYINMAEAIIKHLGLTTTESVVN